jgi:stage V sporulation protein B
MIPVMNLSIGVAVKIALTWILTGIPAFNVQGAALGTVCAFAIASILNYNAARKYTELL